MPNHSELRIPVTLIAGAQDKVVDPRGHSQRFHEEYPQSRFQLVPDAGPMAHYAAPDLVCAAVEELGIRRPAAASCRTARQDSGQRPLAAALVIVVVMPERTHIPEAGW